MRGDTETGPAPTAPGTRLPRRFGLPGPIGTVVLVVLAGLFLHGVHQAEITLERLLQAGPRLAGFWGSAFPPDFSAFVTFAPQMLETLQMALIGTVLGLAVSLPAALLAASNTTPHPAVATTVRTIVTTLRAIPELVWALIFIVAVGLGPLAGILAIAADVVGFAGRFFAERIEEVDRGPVESLRSTGAGRLSVIACAILPPALPSFTGTSLYCYEKSVRSAVVLGLVGAGGIGVEFSTSMTMFRYDEALGILLLILITLIVVERLSVALRRRVI